jgi:hypothetical protein
MSDDEEQRLEEAIQECVERELTVLFWKGVKLLGIPTIAFAVSLVIFYARLTYHVEDHHERILIEMSADVKHLKVDMAQVKKGMESN